MAGRFAGLSDAEWELFEDIFPEKAGKGRGMPAAHSHKALNSMMLILMTGCRWCGLLQGPQSGAAGGSFSPWNGKGGGAEAAYGFKGKLVLIHLR